MTCGGVRMKELANIGPPRVSNRTPEFITYVLSMKCPFCAIESRFKKLNGN